MYPPPRLLPSLLWANSLGNSTTRPEACWMSSPHQQPGSCLAMEQSGAWWWQQLVATGIDSGSLLAHPVPHWPAGSMHQWGWVSLGSLPPWQQQRLLPRMLVALGVSVRPPVGVQWPSELGVAWPLRGFTPKSLQSATLLPWNPGCLGAITRTFSSFWPLGCRETCGSLLASLQPKKEKETLPFSQARRRTRKLQDLGSNTEEA